MSGRSVGRLARFGRLLLPYPLALQRTYPGLPLLRAFASGSLPHPRLRAVSQDGFANSASLLAQLGELHPQRIWKGISL